MGLEVWRLGGLGGWGFGSWPRILREELRFRLAFLARSGYLCLLPAARGLRGSAVGGNRQGMRSGFYIGFRLGTAPPR